MATIEINCEEVWKEISNFVDGEITPELCARMEAHFKICAHCSAVLDGMRNVIGLVGDGKIFQLPDGFSKKLQQRIRDLP